MKSEPVKFTESAPAKINLALDILNRRADGYHNLRMIMQTVSLCDTVTLEECGNGFVLDTEGITFPAGEISLEQRAAMAFFREIKQPLPGLRVNLKKKIPAYAGLGGGSADVAALLRLLRRRYCPAMPDETLQEIGLQIGSDIPFCVRGGTAFAQGRGEILTDLPPLPDCCFVLCKPAFGIPTPALFARVDKIRSPDAYTEVDTAPAQVQSDTAPAQSSRNTAPARTQSDTMPPQSSCNTAPAQVQSDTMPPQSSCNAAPAHSPPDVYAAADALRGGDLPALPPLIHNVFENFLPDEYAEVFTIKRQLLRLGAENACMSGSGPTVFGIFFNQSSAVSAYHTLKAQYSETFLAKPVSRAN